MLNSAGTVGRAYTKLYIMNEHPSDFSLTASQADMMKKKVDNGQNKTKIIFL